MYWHFIRWLLFQPHHEGDQTWAHKNFAFATVSCDRMNRIKVISNLERPSWLIKTAAKFSYHHISYCQFVLQQSREMRLQTDCKMSNIRNYYLEISFHGWLPYEVIDTSSTWKTLNFDLESSISIFQFINNLRKYIYTL